MPYAPYFSPFSSFSLLLARAFFYVPPFLLPPPLANYFSGAKWVGVKGDGEEGKHGLLLVSRLTVGIQDWERFSGYIFQIFLLKYCTINFYVIVFILFALPGFLSKMK